MSAPFDHELCFTSSFIPAANRMISGHPSSRKSLLKSTRSAKEARVYCSGSHAPTEQNDHSFAGITRRALLINCCSSPAIAAAVALLGNDLSANAAAASTESAVGMGGGRDFYNTNAVFKEDYLYKFGTRPPRDLSQAADFLRSINGAGSLPFVPMKRRYDYYNRFASRIDAALRAYEHVGEDLRTVSAESKVIEDGLRPMGIFSTQLLCPDVAVTREALLMRYYVNELFFSTREVSAAVSAGDLDTAAAAWAIGRDAANSYVSFVNRLIFPGKVGTKFELVGSK
mmetsp:Transcript_17222/g.37463  ORF Transcript_17222/g.37463 Transcript_17222/m.37463 type:complete len:285 (-) Transcript_17222:22-876(-)